MDSSQLLTIDQARELLGRVGVDVPANTPPQAVFASLNGLLQGVPDRVVAAAVNTGAEVRFGTQAGITVPPMSPLNYAYNVSVEGRTRLSDVETGACLQQTQTFRASVQLQQDDRVALERTMLNRIYRLSEYADHLPAAMRDPLQQARDRIDANPALRTLARGAPVSFIHTESEGSRLTYEAVVPPELGRRLAAGDPTALPNPLDPLSMPVGSSVLIRGQDLRGSSTEAGYRLGLAGVSDTRLDGTGFGIRRLEGSTVEIYSGPMNVIENSAYLGFGRRNIASVRVEAENSIEERRLSVARVDLATPEGQTAYRQFMESGRVPDAVAPGVTGVGHSTELSIEQVRRLGLHLGSASVAFDNSVNQQVTVSNLGGRDEVRFNYSREGRVATESTYPLGSDGRPDVSQGQFRVVLPNVGPNEAGAMRAAFGGPEGARGLGNAQPVELNFDSAQLMELRERSRSYLAGRPGGSELLAMIDAGRPLGIESRDPLVRMAGARDAQQVFGVMQDRPQDIPGALNRLNVGVEADQRRPLPGALEIQPPAAMRESLESRSESERTAIMDRFYRFPPGGAQTRSLDPAAVAPTTDTPAQAPGVAPITAPVVPPTPPAGTPAIAPGQASDASASPVIPVAQTTAGAAPTGPGLTSRDHPDHALFAALRDRVPADVTDDQVARITQQAKQADITPNRLEQVATDRNDPNQLWVVGTIPGFRTKVDLSQPAPPLEQTSADLLARAPAQEPPGQSQSRPPLQQESPHALSR